METCLKAPPPLPLVSGFSKENLYRVLGVYSPSETSEAYLILVNDADQIWFISNRHMRFAKLDPGCPFVRVDAKSSAAVATTG